MAGENRSSGVFYGTWITLLMLYVLFFAGGLGFYTYQVFIPRFEEAFGWSRFQTVGPGALWAVIFGLSGFFVGSWIQRFGARRVMVAGTIAAAAVFGLISMITELWHLWVLITVAGVTSASTTLVPVQTVITLWFNRKRGRAMGLALMGIGLGGLFLPPLVAWLIQRVGWRAAYQLSGLSLLVLVVPALLLFLKDRPADVGEVADGRAFTAAGGAPEYVPSGVTARRAVRSPTFWLIFFTYVMQLYVLSAINTNTTAFAEGVGYGVLVAPLFMSLAVGISVPGRFFYGWISDRVGPHILMAVAGLLLAASTLALDVLVIRLGWIDPTPIWVFGIAHGLGIPASAVVVPILVGRCFGDLEFGKIQGLVMAGFAVGVIFGGPSAAAIFDATGSYQPAFILCTVCGVVSAVLVSLVRPTRLHEEFVTATSE